MPSIMTDQEIIQKLIERDNRVTQDFFYRYCRPIFLNIIRNVFSYEVDYDEFVNELYIYLLENDAKKLKDLRLENQSSLQSWLIRIATRYFVKKRNRMIENQSHETLSEQGEDFEMFTDTTLESRLDTEKMLAAMPNERYAFVLRKLIFEDMTPEALAMEMNTTTSNLYNLKKRAIQQLTQVLMNDINNFVKS